MLMLHAVKIHQQEVNRLFHLNDDQKSVLYSKYVIKEQELLKALADQSMKSIFIKQFCYMLVGIKGVVINPPDKPSSEIEIFNKDFSLYAKIGIELNNFHPPIKEFANQSVLIDLHLIAVADEMKGKKIAYSFNQKLVQQLDRYKFSAYLYCDNKLKPYYSSLGFISKRKNNDGQLLMIRVFK